MGLFGFGRKKEEAQGGDFSAYNSHDAVQAAVRKGVLVPLYLISPRFGGAEDAGNIIYVPPFVAPLKDSQDDIFENLLLQGKKIGGYSVRPQYKGDSFVPASITIRAGGDVDFEETIQIW